MFFPAVVPLTHTYTPSPADQRRAAAAPPCTPRCNETTPVCTRMHCRAFHNNDAFPFWGCILLFEICMSFFAPSVRMLRCIAQGCPHILHPHTMLPLISFTSFPWCHVPSRSTSMIVQYAAASKRTGMDEPSRQMSESVGSRSVRSSGAGWLPESAVQVSHDTILRQRSAIRSPQPCRCALWTSAARGWQRGQGTLIFDRRFTEANHWSSPPQKH
jgi:hypothetical protein